MEKWDATIEKADESYENKEYAQAYELYLEAAIDQEPRAIMQLAKMYYWGVYVRKDYKKAYDYYRILADANDTEAMEKVISITFMLRDEKGYIEEFGMSEDNERIINYLSYLVDQGDTKALIYLGGEYELGISVKQNVKKAVEIYEKAVEMGDKFGNEMLGELFFSGTYTETDYDKAFHYYSLNPELQLSSTYRLAQMYDGALGTSKDYEKAIELYKDFVERYEQDLAFFSNLGVKTLEGEFYPVAKKRLEELLSNLVQSQSSGGE